MLRSFLQSLHFRLIALILLASLPMAGLIFYASLDVRSHAYRHEEEDALQLARIMVAEHEQILSAAARLVQGLARDPDFLFVESEACAARLAGIIGGNLNYSGIALTDPDGVIHCSHPAAATPRLAESDVFRAAVSSGDLVVSNHIQGSLSGKEIVIVAAPVFDAAGEILGVLAVGIDLVWTADYIDLVELPPDTSFILMDRNGTILLRHPARANYLGTAASGQPIVMEVRSSAEAGVMQTEDLDGVERLYGFAPVLEPVPYSGYVLVGIPVTQAYAEADRELVRNMTGLGIITAAILGIARFAAMRLILTPVGKLNRAIERMQAGDLGARTGVRYQGDEISEMARAFDELAASLEQSRRSLNGAYDRTLDGWSRALDLRDHETEGHSQRVTQLTLDLARAMGVRDPDLQNIRRGALLHDIGKIGIPDEILNKPGPLDENEWQVMRRHPMIAHELLADIDFLRPALEIPLRHHEKWDGSGYPDGLKGDAIPLSARIFAVADVWDALRSNRPYRAAWPDERALEYIKDQSGSHFDPAVVEMFLSLVGADIRVEDFVSQLL